MGFWDSVKRLPGQIGDFIGNPMDWGKNPINPSEAHLADEAYLRDYLHQQLGSVGQRQAPLVGQAQRMTAATIDPALQAQMRQRQMTLADQLAGIGAGTRKGAGEMAVGRQFQQGLGAQLAAARMARGANAALGARSAARNIGGMTVDAAGQSAQAALGDQAQAQGLLAGLLGQGRQADIDLAAQQAGLQQQAGLANQQAQNEFALADQAAKLQQMGMNDQAIAQYLASLYNMDATQMAAKLGLLQGNQNQQGLLGDLLQMGGTLGAAYIGKPG